MWVSRNKKKNSVAQTLFVVTEFNMLSVEQLKWVEACLKEQRLVLILSDDDFWNNASMNSLIPSLVGFIMSLPKVSFEQFCKILQHRHNLSGFTMRISQKTLDARFWNRTDVQKTWLKWLYQFSNGSLENAIDLWLLAIAQIDEHSITLSADLCRHKVKTQKEQSPEEMLIARQCLRFGWASLDRMQSWFGIEEQTAEAVLIRLEQDGVLKRETYSEVPRWLLSSAHRPRLRRMLRKRGWL